jgi:hypothetical protein
MKTIYAVTNPIFQINRGFICAPKPMYLGSTFTQLASDPEQRVTLFRSLEDAKSYAQSVKNNEFAVGILVLGLLDPELANNMVDNTQITLDPEKILLYAGYCPRLDNECRYGIADQDKTLADKLKSDKPLNERIADYFKCYYQECGFLYKAFGIDHVEVAASIVEKMSQTLPAQEIVSYLKDKLKALLAESRTNVAKSFYKTLAYALAEIQDQPSHQVTLNPTKSKTMTAN